jgi:hypothetical protein
MRRRKGEANKTVISSMNNMEFVSFIMENKMNKRKIRYIKLEFKVKNFPIICMME